MSFINILEQYAWKEIEEKINNCSYSDVEKALAKDKLDMNDIMALVSPAAGSKQYLEAMAHKSRQRTQQRFGKTIQLYIPLYLSNHCNNSCIYCGFSIHNKIDRLALTDEQILQELHAIREMNYEHILIVTGEDNRYADVRYIEHAIKLIKPRFASVSAEIQPLNIHEYKALIDAGLNSVYIYQETYNLDKYKAYHIAGKKANFQYRLETPDRLGIAGIYRIGLGALLGLENWRVEAFFMALHLRYLQKHYWRTKYSLSFPRIRPHEGGFMPANPVNDKELAQLIWAFRLFDEDVEMALSTREDANFRDNMMPLGITSMSAGSKTEPGGYAAFVKELAQFSVNDSRSAWELEAAIRQHGYEAIWKDWDGNWL